MKGKKRNSFALAVMVAIAVVVSGIIKFFEKIGFVIPGLVLIAYIGFLSWRKVQERERRKLERENARLDAEKRKHLLLQKYEDEQIVDRILNQSIWVGETSEQLLDSLGSPQEVDQKVLKTKKKEVWKYGLKGANRYKYKITLDNDEVVGWDEKA